MPTASTRSAFQSASGAIVPGNGGGETIALIEAYHDPSLAADLHVFDQANDLPDPQLTVIDQAGTKTNSTWASEESLDVEWAHAIAPGANILVVEARSQTLKNLLSAVDTARKSPGVVAVSMSWGFNEFADETVDDAHFTTPAGHAGITFVAASGDNGLRAGAEYPAASPDVLAVGGTTLNLNAAGNYLSETAWHDSGGGYSLYEPEPSYQDSIQSTGYRSTPDVAFDANPNTGVEVYETPLHGGQGAWQTVGGTSLATPAWAALIAIVDQGRALAGEDSLDGPTQTLPALYSLPSTDFHVVGASAAEDTPSGGGVNPFGFLSLGGITFSRHHFQKSTRPTAGSTRNVGSQPASGLQSPQLSSPISWPATSRCHSRPPRHDSAVELVHQTDRATWELRKHHALDASNSKRRMRSGLVSDRPRLTRVDGSPCGTSDRQRLNRDLPSRIDQPLFERSGKRLVWNGGRRSSTSFPTSSVYNQSRSNCGCRDEVRRFDDHGSGTRWIAHHTRSFNHVQASPSRAPADPRPAR